MAIKKNPITGGVLKEGQKAGGITTPKYTTTTPTTKTTQTYTAPKTTTPTVAATNVTPAPIPENPRPSDLPPDTPDWWGGGGGGGGSRSSANSAYQDALAALKAQQAIEEEAARARKQATIDSINANIPTINQDYENQQVQNYITHTKNMFGLGDFLRAQGLSGGMTESKAGELTANYETSRNAADQAKNNALQNIQNLIAQAQATGDQELATIASSATKAYRELLAQQAAAELQAERDAQDQANWQAYYDLNKSNSDFSNDLATKQYQLALQKAKQGTASIKKTSGGGGLTAGQTLSAIQSAYESGDMSYDEYLNAISGLGVKVNNNVAQPTTNYYAEAERLIQQRTVPSSQKALIKQWNIEGKLTDAQALELLRRYGLPTD